MDWIARLNQTIEPMPLTGGEFHVWNWAYAEHLPDNVPHRHAYVEACLMGRYGSGEFTIGERVLEICPGDLFIARPGVRHRIRNSQDRLMELRWVCFAWNPAQESVSELSRLWEEFANSTKAIIAGAETPVIELWQALERAASMPNSVGQSQQLRSSTQALLIGILQAGCDAPASIPESPKGQPQAVRLAVRFLQDNLDRPVSIAEAASQSGVSPRHLARLFQEEIGVSPVEYLETARMERAMPLLRSSSLTLTEIAERCGFASVQYFTRRFSLRNGVGPGAYRAGAELGVRKVQAEAPLV